MSSYIWKYTDYGNYSVKSEFQVACNRCNGVVSTSRIQGSFWKNLWNISHASQPKCIRTSKILCQLIFPNLLKTRKVDLWAICPVCAGEKETIEHALLTCNEWTESCMHGLHQFWQLVHMIWMELVGEWMVESTLWQIWWLLCFEWWVFIISHSFLLQEWVIELPVNLLDWLFFFMKNVGLKKFFNK